MKEFHQSDAKHILDEAALIPPRYSVILPGFGRALWKDGA